MLGREECSEENPCPVHGEWKEVAAPIVSFFRRTTVGEAAAGEGAGRGARRRRLPGRRYGTALAWKLGGVTAMIVVSALHDFVLGPRTSAAKTSANSNWNFNGYANATITVPQGYEVAIEHVEPDEYEPGDGAGLQRDDHLHGGPGRRVRHGLLRFGPRRTGPAEAR